LSRIISLKNEIFWVNEILYCLKNEIRNNFNRDEGGYMNKLSYPLENIKLSIWSAFPTVDLYRNFKSEKRNISITNQFIELAHRQGLIPKKNEADFEALLNRCKEFYQGRKPSIEFTFDALIGEIKQETSVKRLVNELKGLAKIFGFEEPNEVLFTRLKKDFYANSIRKHHALMLLSIWLGLNKPNLALNYQTLLYFPRNSSQSMQEEKTGVLAAFAFLGEYIDASMIDFLKRELTICSRDLKITYLNEKRIQYLATTCLARFPVKEGFVGFPSSYGEAIRDALSLAYQMIITWQLSSHYDARINFIIALDAGLFDNMELMIKDLLDPSLPSEPSIRLSRFACNEAEQAQQQVIFKVLRYPNVWSVEHFWAFPRFQSPPCLMTKGTTVENDHWLPVKNETVRAFRDALILGDTKSFKILSILYQYPPKILLSLDIVKILIYRRIHRASIRLLSFILSTDPKNYIARTLRLSNFMLLGNATNDLDKAELFYDQGMIDGQIIERDNPLQPTFYSEYSQIYFSKAVKLIKLLRKGLIKEGGEARQAEVFELLRKAEHFAKIGMISRAIMDTRCTTYLLYYTAFRRLIEKDRDLLTNGGKPFADPHGIYPAVAKLVYDNIGRMVPKDGKGSIDEDFWDKSVNLAINNVLNSGSSAINNVLSSGSSVSYYIGTLFFSCIVLWDFSRPEKRKQIIDQALFFLDISIEKIEELKKLCLGIYSLSSAYPAILSPEEYISWIKKAKLVLEEIKKTGNYETGTKLAFLNFDDEVNCEPITFDLIQAQEKGAGKGTHF